MSALPSPLKSPVVRTFHSDPGTFEGPRPEISVAPSISHTEIAPVLVSWNRMSALPSWLKSVDVIAFQFDPGIFGGPPPAIRLVPSISQTEIRPVETF